MELFDTESKKVSKGSSRALSRARKAALSAPEDIQKVFNEWVQLCKGEGARGPKPRLSDERQVLIGSAVHDYGLQTCLDAVLGCSQSSWHMGGNPAGKKYNDLELIFRNSQKIERFAEIGVEHRTKGGFLDE